MSTNSTGSILVRRGPTADRLLFCPLPGEIIYDTILKQLFVGDGVTLGGIAVGTGGGCSGGGSGGGGGGATGASGASGASGPPGTITTSSLLELLSGAITETQLFKDLQDRINLIDGDYTLANSVAARIKSLVDTIDPKITAVQNQADALNDSLLAEAQARAEALLNEVANRTAAIDVAKRIVQNNVESLASQVETFHASLNGNTAAIQEERTARATANSVLATDLLTVAARLNNFNGTGQTAEAFVTSERTARISDNQVYASNIDTLTARVGNAESTIVDAEIVTQKQATLLTQLNTRLGAAESSITNYSTTTASQAQSLFSLRTSVDGALSSISELNTTTASQAESLTQIKTKVGNNESAISTLNTTTAIMAVSLNDVRTKTDNAESAISTLNKTTLDQAVAISQVITRLDNAYSAITNINTTTVDYASSLNQLVTVSADYSSQILSFQETTASQAQAIYQLNSRLNNAGGEGVSIEQKFNTNASDIANLYAEYTLKIDNNGYVSGFGLASSPTESAFAINANRFYIASPTNYSGSTTPTSPTNGQTWFNSTDKKTYRWNGTAWVLFQPIIPFTVQTTPVTINGVTLEPGVYMDNSYIRNLNADNINVTSLSAITANIGTLKTNNTNSYRVEISDVGDYPIWYGSGDKNYNNANFFLDKTGNIIIKGAGFGIIDASGNVVMSSGGAVWDYIQGAKKPADGATRNVYVGNWESGVSYVIGDIVFDSNGAGWICILAHTSSISNTTPEYPATSNTYWNTYIAKGADAITSIVPNSSHTFSASSSGVVDSYLGSGTTISLYEGSTMMHFDGEGSSVSTPGYWKISSKDAVNITVGTISDLGDTASVADHSGIADNIDQSSITYHIIGKRIGGADFTYIVNQTFSKSKSTSNLTIYNIEVNSPVITKQAPNAATSGNHSTLIIQGKKYLGSSTSNYGWITLTGNGDTEATTATDTATSAYTFTPTNTAGKTSYKINMYDKADVATATLLDTADVSVLFTGEDSISAILSNETHILPADASGVVDLLHGYDGSGTTIQVYDGNTKLQYDGIGTSTGHWKVIVNTSANVTPSTPSVSGTDAVYGNHSGVSNTIDVSTIDYLITGKKYNGSTFSITKTQTLTKSKTGLSYITVIESTNGDTFRVGEGRTTLLKAHVFLNGVEVTDIIPAGDFRWRRVSMYPELSTITDTNWNTLYFAGYKTITVNVDEVDSQATFFCDIISN